MTQRLRLVFAGTPEFAVPCLDALTRVADVAHAHLDRQAFGVVRVPGEHPHRVPGVGEPADQVTAQPAGSAGHEDHAGLALVAPRTAASASPLLVSTGSR